MKLRLDTGALALPGHGATVAWIGGAAGRHTDRLEAVREMRAVGLTPLDIRRLLRRIEHERTALSITAGWPTAGQDNATLRAAADLARALADVLRGASPRAQAELATAALLAIGNVDFPHAVVRDLAMFSAALNARIERMPNQSRRSSPAGIVRAVVEVAGDKLGAPTTWPGSPFRRACVAAFALAGNPNSPDRAIQRIGDRSPKSGGNRP